MTFFNTSSGPIGSSIASALLFCFSVAWKPLQRSHSRVWRRTGGESLVSPSATSASSIRTSSQEIWRAWAASARPPRARTSSDLTLGTVVSIASAIWS